MIPKEGKMFDQYKTRSQALKSRLTDWRLAAAVTYMLSVVWAIATPILASRIQYQVAEGAMHHWLIRMTIGSWPVIYGLAIVSVFVLIELLNVFFIREGRYTYPESVDKMVAELSVRAGLGKIPHVIYLPSKFIINAGAGVSYLFGNKVILFGNILSLKHEQLEAVIAHEIAHLRMGDVVAGHILGSLMFAVRFVNKLLLLSVMVAMFVSDHDVLWFLASTYVVTMIGSFAARVFQLKHSRICEYRADAIAIDLTSVGHRKHLIDALKVVRELSFVAAIKKNEMKEVDSGTHPTLRNRARSLGIDLFLR